MTRTLTDQATELQRVMAGLVKKYQFRDRNETVGYGLSVSQAYVLRALRELGPLSMGALATELHLSVSTMTRGVDPLVRAKRVRRVRDPEDRRLCRVELTAEGRRLWDRIERGLIESDAAVLGTLSSRQREAVIRVIGQLSSAVDEWRTRAAAEA